MSRLDVVKSLGSFSCLEENEIQNTLLFHPALSACMLQVYLLCYVCFNSKPTKYVNREQEGGREDKCAFLVKAIYYF